MILFSLKCSVPFLILKAMSSNSTKCIHDEQVFENIIVEKANEAPVVFGLRLSSRVGPSPPSEDWSGFSKHYTGTKNVAEVSDKTK